RPEPHDAGGPPAGRCGRRSREKESGHAPGRHPGPAAAPAVRAVPDPPDRRRVPQSGHPEMLMPGARSLVLGIPADPAVPVYARTETIALVHVVRLQPLEGTPNGSNGRQEIEPANVGNLPGTTATSLEYR